MLVTYKPEGAEPQSWEFNPSKVRTSRAEMIEKRYGHNFNVFTKAIQAGDAKSRRVLLWHLLNLQHPTLRFEDTPDFMFGELEIEYSITEMQKLRRELAESALDDSEKEMILRRMDLEIATMLGKEDGEPLTAEDLGKEQTSSKSD